MLYGRHGLAQRCRRHALPAAGVLHPVAQNVGRAREELRLARGLPRQPARHEDLDDHRAPAQRPAVVVVRAEVDRELCHVLGVLVATPAPALRRGEEVREQRVAFLGRGLLVVVG